VLMSEDGGAYAEFATHPSDTLGQGGSSKAQHLAPRFAELPYLAQSHATAGRIDRHAQSGDVGSVYRGRQHHIGRGLCTARSGPDTGTRGVARNRLRRRMARLGTLR
jgi:hypothetical protein